MEAILTTINYCFNIYENLTESWFLQRDLKAEHISRTSIMIFTTDVKHLQTLILYERNTVGKRCISIAFSTLYTN